MRRYTKNDVERHSAGYYAPFYPAVNVKVRSLWHYSDAVEKRFNCDEAIAEKALEFAFEMAQDCFWNEQAQETAEFVFGKGVKIYSAGRSSGWLIVEGLTDIEDWNAVDLAKWRSFEKQIKALVDDLTSQEHMLDDIAANRWAEVGAEQYNYFDDKSGKSHCVVDEKKAAALSD